MSQTNSKAAEDDVRLIDAICHYRAKAILLGAKPTDMLTPFDRELCEKGVPDDIGAAFDVTDIWDELEKAEKERDEARAEVERLQSVVDAAALGVSEMLAKFLNRERAAYRRGAEAMREAAANWLDAPYENIDAEIRNLPIPEDKP